MLITMAKLNLEEAVRKEFEGALKYYPDNELARNETTLQNTIRLLKNIDQVSYIANLIFNYEETENKYSFQVYLDNGWETDHKIDELELSKDQLRDILKFYNGLIGQGVGQYATNLASRDATITSGTLEVSGGSRLNYRVHPRWGTHIRDALAHQNYSLIEVDN